MASSTPPQPDYSTLELDTNAHSSHRFFENNPQQFPEVNRHATTDRDYPEVAHPYPIPKYDPPYVPPPEEPRICGLRRKTFFIVLGVVLVVAGAVIAGVVVGVTKKGGNSSTPSDSNDNRSGRPSHDTKDNKTGILPDTNIAATNFTDDYGYSNYIILYQLRNLAIYMSAYNSSEKAWIVSPVVDGSNGVSLDTVRNGTNLAIDVYWHNDTWRDIHLYWQSPNNAVKTLFRNNISTTEVSGPEDWTYPFETDRFSASDGSSVVSYARECPYCTLYTYVFFQDAEDGIMGGVLFGDNEEGWEDRNFTDITAPATNTSLALASVRATNTTDRGMNIFYQTKSGVLAQLTYNGGAVYEAQTLSRGLSDQSAIVAFSTGFNDTSGDRPPQGFHVLTTDPGSDAVLLTYYNDGEWVAGDEVSALSDCAARSVMALNPARRLYCLVDGDDGDAEIHEWVWRGEPVGDTDSFYSWDKVGTVDTIVK
ncbi:hypothetical protein QQZ08_002428 [Neonectria magnoliae]|uniref:Fucose-specific lectin n=1 Tax=Neonectria magnoliae TaxID=2732573 RepID=A0ABR1IBR9_9HYPO